MKVIGGSEKWTATRTCKSCKAELEIGIEDVVIRYVGGDYTEVGTETVCALCCVCGTSVVVANVWDAPPLVTRAAKANHG